jgi:hypothetical protein
MQKDETFRFRPSLRPVRRSPSNPQETLAFLPFYRPLSRRIQPKNHRKKRLHHRNEIEKTAGTIKGLSPLHADTTVCF